MYMYLINEWIVLSQASLDNIQVKFIQFITDKLEANILALILAKAGLPSFE